MKRFRILFCGLCAAAVLGFIGLLLIGSILVSPRPSIIGVPPQNLPIEIVEISKGDDGLTHGWFLQGQLDKAGILLLHGVGANRVEMLDRARFLFSAGYSVLLIDMQAHGETIGDHITFGVLESIDVHSSIEYLRNRVNNKIGIIGSC